VTADEFIAQRPEFRNAGAIIGPTITDAARRIDANVFGDNTENAISLLTAHLLCISPYGRTMKLATVEDDGSTIYLKEYERLRRECVLPIIVL